MLDTFIHVFTKAKICRHAVVVMTQLFCSGSFGNCAHASVLPLLQLDGLKLFLDEFACIYGWIELSSLGCCKVTQWLQNLVRCDVTKDSR